MNIKQHFNKPQLRSALIDAPVEYLIAGRALGKTTKVLARKSAQRYLGSMPRGTHVAINATFTQAFTRTLKELIRGWQDLGYIMDHHFVVCQKPSEKWKKKWKWKGPYAPPLDFKYFVSWYNGAVMQLVSQERVGSSNGISIDSIIGDEAKLLNEEKFKTELLPANRGIIPEFAGNPYHHGITLTTDMPIGTAGRWLLDKFSAMDKVAVNQIWQIQTAIYKLKHQIKPKLTKLAGKEIDKQIAVLEDELTSLRKGLVYYHEASTLDNIHALGIDYIKQQLRDTSSFQFDTQILNIRPLRLEDGFYPDFKEEEHGYFAESAEYFDRSEIDYLNVEFDCRKDTDLNPDLPLHISLDYNRRIHPIVVAQDDGSCIKIINGIHALYPDMLRAAVSKFCKYYRFHKRKTVYYWYDHTAVGGMEETPKCQEVVDALKKDGWIVYEMYIGKQPGHESRYRLYGHLLSEDEHYPKVLRINRENCRSLIMSLGMAEAEKRKEGFGKSKKSEHDDKVPAEESTHYSDALDTLCVGMLESQLNYSTISIPRETIITR